MADQTFLKQINYARIMNAIRLHAPISRSEIAKKVGLDKKSVSNLLNSAIESGIVIETGKKKPAKGRPHTMLSFDNDRHLALGIAVTENSVRACLLDLFGSVKATHEIEFALDGNRDTIMSAVKRVYLQLKGSTPGTIGGVGLSVPGIINLEEGYIKSSINIPAFNDFNIKEALKAFIEEELFLEEGSRAKALAEKWFGLGKGASNFVCVDLGIGIGAGIVHEGRLFPGNLQFMGEIGHIMLERGGRKCRCGKTGCLECYLSETIILNELNQAQNSEFRNIEDAAQGKLYPGAEKVLDEAGYLLGVALSYVVNIVCPPLIVINGTLMDNFGERIMPKIRQGLEECALHDCLDCTDIKSSELKNAASLGAAARVLSNKFEVKNHFYV